MRLTAKTRKKLRGRVGHKRGKWCSPDCECNSCVIRALLDALDERDDAVQEMNGEAQHYSDALSREREEWQKERKALREQIEERATGR